VLAVEISRHGGPEELVVVERPEPAAGPGQVVVHNRWIGVNYVDLQHRAGQPYPVGLPLVPGTEAAGTVVAVGAGADAGLTGARVVHFGHLGGVYAELTAVPTEFVVPLADGTALDTAAAVTMNGTTAYVLTSMASRIGPGDVVVVQAAAGGTGGAVVQLAAAAGAEVIAITSSAGKAQAAAGLGARHGVALEQVADPVAAVLSVTGGRGADVVYDAGGRDTFEMSLDMLATRGTLVLYGQSSGAVGQVAAGRLSPRIAGRFPLSRASEAHALLADRNVLGKILLQA
jgi:NADPH2:quinone reductase